MRKNDKVQILDRNHPKFLRYGVFLKNKRGGKVLIRVQGEEIEILKGSIESV